MLLDPKKVTHIKRRISQNLRQTSEYNLRLMVTPPSARFYRRQWLKMYGIPWNAGIEDYLKRRVGYKLGILKKA